MDNPIKSPCTAQNVQGALFEAVVNRKNTEFPTSYRIPYDELPTTERLTFQFKSCGANCITDNCDGVLICCEVLRVPFCPNRGSGGKDTHEN